MRIDNIDLVLLIISVITWSIDATLIRLRLLLASFYFSMLPKKTNRDLNNYYNFE